MEVKVTPAGMVTATGVLLEVVVLLPSCSALFRPQQYAVPLLLSAQACALPVEIDEKVTPAGVVTATGILLYVVVPLPSCP
jgi:hypothetical protein